MVLTETYENVENENIKQCLVAMYLDYVKETMIKSEVFTILGKLSSTRMKKPLIEHSWSNESRWKPAT